MQSIVFLHGALGAASQWEPVLALLKDRYNVYSFNFSGHGGQPFSEEFSIDSFRVELENFLDANALEKVTLIGYSMGGYVAMAFAIANPHRAARIVTLGTKFDWDPDTASKETKMLNPDRIEEKIPAFAATLKSLHAPNDWRQLLTETAGLMYSLGQHRDGWISDFTSIRVPVLLLLGEEDRMVTREETIAVQVALHTGSFGVLPGMPHPLTQTDPALLASFIRDFIN